MILTLPLPALACASKQAGYHTPVLFDEVIEWLKVIKGGKYIDATLGGGGYTFEIVKRGGVVLGIDRDREAIRYVKKKCEMGGLRRAQSSRAKWEIGKEIFLERGNFADLKKTAEKFGLKDVLGIIFDLGMSTFQIESSGRGFSFKKDEPLDMRMDCRQKLTAADVINLAGKERLYEIFSKFAEELHSRAIAEAIFRARTLKGPITRTRELVDIVKEVIDKREKKASERNYARIFQALRIVVNNEVENLKKGLSDSFDLLQTGGRVIVLSYHSLEDRVVKFKYKEAEKKGILRIITKQSIRADQREICANFKARSAHLRIAEKIHG